MAKVALVESPRLAYLDTVQVKLNTGNTSTSQHQSSFSQPLCPATMLVNVFAYGLLFALVAGQ